MRTSGLGPSSAPRLGGAESDFTHGHSRGRCAPGPWHTGPLLCRDAQGKTHPDFTGVAAAAGREEGARPGPRTAGGRGNIPPPGPAAPDANRSCPRATCAGQRHSSGVRTETRRRPATRAGRWRASAETGAGCSGHRRPEQLHCTEPQRPAACPGRDPRSGGRACRGGPPGRCRPQPHPVLPWTVLPPASPEAAATPAPRRGRPPALSVRPATPRRYAVAARRARGGA